MMLLILFVMSVGNPCTSGDVFTIDGDTTRDAELAAFRLIERLTGLDHSLGSSTITAIERQAKVALARRLGMPVLEHELREAFALAQAKARKKKNLRQLIRRVGESAYMRWVTAPRLASDKLEHLFDRDTDDWIRGRATRILKDLLAGLRSMTQVRKTLQRDARYVRFRLTPDDMLQHIGGGARMGYLADVEAYKKGELMAHPKPPNEPVDLVEGLGYGEPGYVKDLVAIVAKVGNGEYVPHVVRDKEQWMVLRRLANNAGVFEIDGIAIRVPPFPVWLNQRFRDLRLTVCSADARADARRVAPQNPIVELMK
ncbi:MAG: hypothetical protein VX589_14015 [Myxococcota bacterium]|nr:hypothetical protein [Myxococcota bacterium]